MTRSLKASAYLQVMHKAPILESKQIEHVLNERRILEEASSHPFCVGLVRAYQDKPCLYLLQEWVGGQPPPPPPRSLPLLQLHSVDSLLLCASLYGSMGISCSTPLPDLTSAYVTFSVSMIQLCSV